MPGTPTPQNPYGTAGNLTNVGPNFDPSTLPSWLSSQFFKSQVQQGGEGDNTTSSQWSYNQNLKNQAGQSVVQLGGDWKTASGSNGGVIDPSKVINDPVLGPTTDPNNIRTVNNTLIDKLVGPQDLALIGGLGLAGAAGLLGDAAAGTTGAASTGAAALPGMAPGAFESGGNAFLLGSGTPGASGIVPGFVGAGEGDAAGVAAGLGSGGGTTAGAVGAGATGAGAAGAGAGSSGGGFGSLFGQGGGLSQLNSVRSALGVISALTGKGGGTMPTTGGDPGALVGGLGTDIGSILSLIGSGRSAGLWGGGVGTPSGATNNANSAAALADPWGASGQRASFSSALNPQMVMQMLGYGPNGQSNITSNPAYQFDLSQGTGAINAGSAAQGSLYGGARGEELQAFGSGLAAKYQSQNEQMGASALGVLGGFAGVNAGSPAAAGQMTMGGFNSATSLQNQGLNTGLGGILSGVGSSVFGALGSLGSSASSILSSLFGNSSNEVLSDGVSGITGSTAGMTSGSSDLSDIGQTIFGAGAGW